MRSTISWMKPGTTTSMSRSTHASYPVIAMPVETFRG
jgi:hypothetical protein